MKIAALSTKSSKFLITLDDTNFIDELFYRPLSKFLFKNYRDEIWKNFMRDYQIESELTLCLAEIFYNFSKNKESKEKFLELLKINNNDFTLRFLLQCILEKKIKAAFYIIFSISFLLEDSNYFLPSFSDKFLYTNN